MNSFGIDRLAKTAFHKSFRYKRVPTTATLYFERASCDQEIHLMLDYDKLTATLIVFGTMFANVGPRVCPLEILTGLVQCGQNLKNLMNIIEHVI